MEPIELEVKILASYKTAREQMLYKDESDWQVTNTLAYYGPQLITAVKNLKYGASFHAKYWKGELGLNARTNFTLSSLPIQ